MPGVGSDCFLSLSFFFFLSGAYGGVTRLFSFQMPAPPKLLVVLIYKHEAPFQAVTLVPELTTQESHSCNPGNMTALLGKEICHCPCHFMVFPREERHIILASSVE